MGLFDLPETGNALENLFDRERKAILTGRFDLLERLGHEKERLLTAISRNAPETEQLSRLRQLADRNRDLLDAMARGVRAATRRLESLAGGSANLKTYDAAGQRQTIAPPRHALQHRA